MTLKNLERQVLEIELSLKEASSAKERFLILMQFEEFFSKNQSVTIYSLLTFWPLALELGKINLAIKYAQSAIEKLIEHKRIPALKEQMIKIKEKGLLKHKWAEYEAVVKILEGESMKLTSSELLRIDLLCDHPEKWKNQSEFLKQYLLLESEWNLEQWKLCYEYILKYYYDFELFKLLYEKSKNLNYESHSKKFENFFHLKKIKLPKSRDLRERKVVVKETQFKLDYDQVALNLLSGKVTPNMEEQVRVLNSLKYIDDRELKDKGAEMVVAFELLGMDKVVFELCEKLIAITEDVKQKASLYYMWAQSLYNSEEYFKCIDIVDAAIEKEPLINDELMAFIYLKAESCLKINNKPRAKELFNHIKAKNPNYRMVKERLREIG